MAGVDISLWVGRPPPGSKAKGSKVQDSTREAEQETIEHKNASNSPQAESGSPEDMSAVSQEDEGNYSSPNTLSTGSRSPSIKGFYIDIPDISYKDEYEHLPGYYTVVKILREVRTGHYLVKLKSGEVDLVSISCSLLNMLSCRQFCQVSSHCHVSL
jgi:hypothetical protein